MASEPKAQRVTLPASNRDTLEGAEMPANSAAERSAALHEAVDYRGDITLLLDDGSQVVGYVYDLRENATPPTLRLRTADAPEPVTIQTARVAAVRFSGRDAAAGRTWEGWLRKVERAKAEGKIAELYPEEAD